MKNLILILILFTIIISCNYSEEQNSKRKTILNKEEFLNINIYKGLKNLNNGFDAPSIKYFSEEDFEKVLTRVEKFNLGIYGIEPWKNGEFYDVKGYEEYGTIPTNPKWYKKAFEEFKKSGNKLQYSATYQIPNSLLK